MYKIYVRSSKHHDLASSACQLLKVYKPVPTSDISKFARFWHAWRTGGRVLAASTFHWFLRTDERY